MSIRRIYLIGMPGSGKSTTGRLLAEKLHLPFLDLDQEIEEVMGKSIPQIFGEEGEGYFRKKEAEVLRLTIARNPRAVIACGGGTPCFYFNDGLLDVTGTPVYIQVEAAELAARLEREGKEKRPLLREYSGDKLVAFMEEKLKNRAPYYEKARLTISTNGEGPAEVAERILKHF